MNASQIHTTYKSALHFLSQGQLKNAFDKTQLLVNELQMGEFTDRLDDLRQNYRYLLDYFINGIEDPQRKIVYNKLVSKIFVLNSELREELLLRNSTNFEYTQKRFFPHSRRHSSTEDLFNALNYYHTQSKILESMENRHDVEMQRVRLNYESLLPEIFGLFWLSTTYRAEERRLFTRVMEANYPGWLEKTLIVSGLTLNLWRMFDESKLMLLFDACLDSDQRVRQRALVGLCFILARYNRFLPYYPAVRNRLVILSDDNHMVENFRNIIMQLIGTAETDKISKKMREEILPEMMKISPLLKDKMDTESLMNTDEWGEENPAWHDILEQSGVSDKLKELSELQLEGADVYMSTFSLLKSFPFFSEFTHWFMPFDPQHTAINDLFKTEEKTVLSSFVNSVVMCNSDKYSFCLSILQMPGSQRDLLKQSFSMEAEQMEEMSKEEAMLTPDVVAKNISKQYIQDLFRFFKLYPQRADFSDMFAFTLLMHRSFLFDILSSGRDLKIHIGEYYFSKSLYNEALEVFQEVQHELTPSAAVYQKIGYSYQQTSQMQKALDAYLKADIIQPNDVWTIRKMALCYRLTGDYAKALEFYQHADFLKPNQASILLQIGQCYLELGKYKEALNVYFKLDADKGDNIKVWRAIIWCAFVSGNIEQANYYMGKLLENEPNAHDFLNAGHIAWCKNDLKLAVTHYRKSRELQQNNWDLFLESFNDDKSYLIANGIDADEIPFMVDQLLFDDQD